MPADVVRNFGPSTSQSSTGEAIGHAEDLANVVVNIDPTETILMSRFGRVKNAKQLDWSWITETLDPPQENAWPEKMDYTFDKVGSLRMLHNYQQHLFKSGYITDAQNKSEKIYTPDDIAREKMNILTKIGKDIEFAILKNTVARGESGGDVALTGGVPYFMGTDEMACTVATTGVVTTSSAHGLKTGDFVYFTATTMPTGMDSEDVYYVNVLSSTTFQLYDSIEGAVKEIDTEKVTPSSTGSSVKIVRNNVYNLDGEDYTLEDVNHVLELAKRRGGNPTEAYMSTKKFSRFNNLVNALVTTNRKSGEHKMDMVTTTYVGPNGIVNAHAHHRYSDKRIDFYDMQYWHLKYFDNIHQVKGLAKTGTYEKFAAEGWVGLQATQPLSSASLIGIKR